MRQLKKFFVMLLCVGALCGLTACGSGKDSTDNGAAKNEATDNADDNMNGATDGTDAKDDTVGGALEDGAEDAGDAVRDGVDDVEDALDGNDADNNRNNAADQNTNR